MQIAKQLSVPLVNKPGRLANVLSALNKEKVTIRAFTVMATGGRGMLRFVPDEPELAISALETINVSYEPHDVLQVDIGRHKGGLPKICQRLAVEHLNIDYAYGSQVSGSQSAAIAVIKVNDLGKAQRVLVDSMARGSLPRKRSSRRPAFSR